MSGEIEVTEEFRENVARQMGEALEREGLNPDTVEAWEDGYRTATQPEAFEWWYFDDDLHEYELHAESGGLVCDLRIKGGAPPWRPGAAVSFFNSARTRYFAWVVPIPYGTVEGEVTSGGETREVSGTLYHDHNWGNAGLGNLTSWRTPTTTTSTPSWSWPSTSRGSRRRRRDGRYTSS